MDQRLTDGILDAVRNFPGVIAVNVVAIVIYELPCPSVPLLKPGIDLVCVKAAVE
jgi:hypothetical protein